MMSHQEVVGYLVFQKVVIAGANTISSPITYGFPAPTGYLGAFHAMSRKLQSQAAFADFSLGGVLLACHDLQVQAYRTSKYSDYTFNQTRNPIKKDGKTASIIEEGKCRVMMSFVVEVLGDDELSAEQKQQLPQNAEMWIQQSRIAGGSVQHLGAQVRFVETESIDDVAMLLTPAFVLMDAQEEFAQLITQSQQQNPEITALDVLLDVATLHHEPQIQANGKVKWTTRTIKQGHGWLVPMPVGYQGIADLYAAGEMQHARNPEYPSQYVECLYGLGKWVYPLRLAQQGDIEQAFWRYQYQPEQSLYLITQK